MSWWNVLASRSVFITTFFCGNTRPWSQWIAQKKAHLTTSTRPDQNNHSFSLCKCGMANDKVLSISVIFLLLTFLSYFLSRFKCSRWILLWLLEHVWYCFAQQQCTGTTWLAICPKLLSSSRTVLCWTQMKNFACTGFTTKLTSRSRQVQINRVMQCFLQVSTQSYSTTMKKRFVMCR